MNEIFNKLIKLGLTPNSFYYLYSLSQNIVPNKFINASLENKKLQADEWITESNALTKKALELVYEIDSYFKIQKKKTSVNKMGENYMEKIEEYLNIFPSFKLPSGKYARTNSKNLETAFRWFFDNYDYKWETVLEATARYVNQFELTGWKYMRTSQYFVRKQSSVERSFDSELANYCDMIEKGYDEYDDFKFKDNIV
jgi:hypothetical protein